MLTTISHPFTCAYCGAQVPADAAVCPNCGRKPIEGMPEHQPPAGADLQPYPAPAPLAGPTSAPYPVPAAPAARPVLSLAAPPKRAYPFLKAFQYLLRLVSVAIIVTALGFILITIVAGAQVLSQLDPSAALVPTGGVILVAIGALVAAFLIALPMLAGAELIQVFLDIESDLRQQLFQQSLNR